MRAVRYECAAEPLLMFNCHCRACQQVAGGPYVPVWIVPSKAFKLTQGKLRYHFTNSIRGERHPNKRVFAPTAAHRYWRRMIASFPCVSLKALEEQSTGT